MGCIPMTPILGGGFNDSYSSLFVMFLYALNKVLFYQLLIKAQYTYNHNDSDK